jgi:squalene-hopene/tetraprenyl-beta-curcumene cyclase
MTAVMPDIQALARDAADRAADHLRRLQAREGWWKGELETNVTMDAEDLLMREFLGIRTAEQTAASARWIRSRQLPDGAWATFYGGPGDLSTTVEAWVALRLAGDPEDAPHLQAAAEFVRAAGGLARTRVFTRFWLALFGLWSWDDVPAVPPEIVLLPGRFPLALEHWGCWARQTIVPLSLVASHRPVRPLPFDADALHAGDRVSDHGLFALLDRALHLHEHSPWKPLRGLARRSAERWVRDRQEADGSWGGIQPPWVYSILALHLGGASLEDPAVARALQGLERFTVVDADAGTRRIEACQSPVWDTGLAMIALADAGAKPDDPSLRDGAAWLTAEEVTVRGDWARRRPRTPPGGWSFEFDNDLYPDVDDTAEVVMALRRSADPDEGTIARAVDWCLGMQCADGGWGAFDADQSYGMPTRLPFCDFGEVVDPPSADVTAHVVEMLAAEGLADTDAVQRGVGWLLDHQEAGGSWFGRWGVNHLYGTGAAVPALVAAGVDPQSQPIRRAVAWLESVQQPDGGWGEDIRSYRDPAWIGRGTATASQTAWALLALLAAGETGDVVDRGVAWLAATQRPDGTWDEPEFTGTGFPWDFSINYHLYRLVFPLTALGRYAQ